MILPFDKGFAYIPVALHTTASYLVMSGAGLREIGDILGHRSLTMVQRYSHLTEDHKFKTVSRMVDDVFGGQI